MPTDGYVNIASTDWRREGALIRGTSTANTQIYAPHGMGCAGFAKQL